MFLLFEGATFLHFSSSMTECMLKRAEAHLDEKRGNTGLFVAV
jgi:hypothetical protein